jgi:Arc/MetJ-type ribon-helix-helix transcriptional regulator
MATTVLGNQRNTDVVVQDDKQDKIRMSLDLTPAMRDIIDRLADRSGSSRSDVLRRAIVLMDALKEAEGRGESPALVDDEGNVRARIVGL